MSVRNDGKTKNKEEGEDEEKEKKKKLRETKHILNCHCVKYIVK